MRKTHRPLHTMHMLLTYKALTRSMSATRPDNTRPIVFVIPMMEIRKVAYSGEMPCREGRSGCEGEGSDGNGDAPEGGEEEMRRGG